MNINKIDKYITEARFPKKSADYNKIKNVDGFWNWNVQDARKAGGLRDLKPETIADVIFWLNMAANAWERTQGK